MSTTPLRSASSADLTALLASTPPAQAPSPVIDPNTLDLSPFIRDHSPNRIQKTFNECLQAALGAANLDRVKELFSRPGYAPNSATVAQVQTRASFMRPPSMGDLSDMSEELLKWSQTMAQIAKYLKEVATQQAAATQG